VSNDWLQNLPQGWDTIRLKNVVKLKTNRIPGTSKDDGYVGLENIQSWTGKLLSSETSVASLEDNDERQNVVNVFDKGDILFGKLRPYLAKAHLAQYSGICSTELLVIKPGKRLDPRYFIKTILAKEFIDQVNAETFGAKMPRADWDTVGNISIPLPPLLVQRAIADYLDREIVNIDARIRLLQQRLALLAEKWRALITHAVTRGLDPNSPLKDSGVEWIGKVPEGWEVVQLKLITQKIGSGKTPKGGGEVYTTKGVPFIRSQNVQFSGLSLDDIVFISETIDQEMLSSRVKSHDVLLNITGASIGRCCVVPNGLLQANVNQHVCIIRPQHNVNAEFLNAVLMSDVGQIQVFLGEVGASRQGLSFDVLGNFWVSKPTYKEQGEIVSYLAHRLNTVDRLAALTQANIGLLYERRTALISAAVMGQLYIV